MNFLANQNIKIVQLKKENDCFHCETKSHDNNNKNQMHYELYQKSKSQQIEPHLQQ